ncbi:hypothetical protein [Meiothermus cerbereus]|uniref:hypothetical protein n=1 Tax=Meiothermus cerbereus TaxID=65552 RepID=UPI003EE90213
MNALLSKLLPHSDLGILLKQEDETLLVVGLKPDNLKTLRAELEASWLELAKEEATIRVKNALAAAQESRRPANFPDLSTKLQLGRATPAERQQLEAYYDALDALQEEAEALLQKVGKVKSVEAINKIAWPEWVGWEALPLRFVLEASSEEKTEANSTKTL